MNNNDKPVRPETEKPIPGLLPLPVKCFENKLQFEEAVQKLLQETAADQPKGIFY
jgi:hypothetical protein